MITSAQILSAEVPEALFSDPNSVEQEYKALAKRFHPDIGGDAETFKHLNILHVSARNKIKIGEWIIPGQLDFISEAGKAYRIRFFKEFPAGCATGYIGKTIVAYVYEKEYADIADAAIKTVSNFTFPDDKIKKEMSLYLPVLNHWFRTKEGKTVVIYSKREDQLRLRDIIDKYKSLDPKHAAWILSRMSNFACWLQFANGSGKLGITHNDLSMDNIYICPEHHTAMVIGGWQYSVQINSRMTRIQTGRTVAALPRSVATTKIADIKTDLTLIRLLGREILGDATGMSFIKNASIPSAMSVWLREAPSGNPVKDFKRWSEVLKSSFGERKFTKMFLNHQDVYTEK